MGILKEPEAYAADIIDAAGDADAAREMFVRVCRKYTDMPASYLAAVGKELFRQLDGE